MKGARAIAVGTLMALGFFYMIKNPLPSVKADILKGECYSVRGTVSQQRWQGEVQKDVYDLVICRQ